MSPCISTVWYSIFLSLGLVSTPAAILGKETQPEASEKLASLFSAISISPFILEIFARGRQK
jgi:hypothetical protein